MSRIDELDIVVRHKGGKVIAGIPQLSLYAKGDDIHAAITSLEQKCADFVADFSEFGVLDGLEVRPYAAKRSVVVEHGDNLGRFTLKALIVIGLVVGTLTASTLWLASRLERVIANTETRVQQYTATVQGYTEAKMQEYGAMMQQYAARMEQYTKLGGAQFWERAEHELERAADPSHELPLEKKQKLLSEIHVVVERWRPFMTEIAPLFSDFQKPASAATLQNEGEHSAQTPATFMPAGAGGHLEGR
jgi:hypothetical protein